MLLLSMRSSNDMIMLLFLKSNYKPAGLTKSEDGVRNLKRCLEVIHTKLNLFRLVSDNSDNLFTKNIDLKVKFPFTVTKKDVDALIKTEEKLSQSILNSMYV